MGERWGGRCGGEREENIPRTNRQSIKEAKSQENDPPVKSAEATDPTTHTPLLTPSAALRPRESPRYPNTTWPTIAPEIKIKKTCIEWNGGCVVRGWDRGGWDRGGSTQMNIGLGGAVPMKAMAKRRVSWKAVNGYLARITTRAAPIETRLYCSSSRDSTREGERGRVKR